MSPGTVMAGLLGGALCCTVCFSQASAQDFLMGQNELYSDNGWIGYWAMEQNNVMNMVLEQQYGRKRQPSSSQRPVKSTGGLIYTPNVRAVSTAQDAFAARVARNNPAAANVLKQQMRAHDFGQVYTNLVAPSGLHRNDAGDAMTAYTVLGWKIANNDLSDGPGKEAVRALRAEIGQAMAAEPKFANPATRAALGEELVISFVTLHAGWQSARREGKLQQYSDGVAAMFAKQTGNDLRHLVLTDRGLERRG